uniref:TubZ protein n=1 Tax=uncultured bacterium esnapd10 TaxID=1366590 RepID=S5TUE2_9BACT|nr:TubZ protein [uncultured bacterium esnapd10]
MRSLEHDELMDRAIAKAQSALFAAGREPAMAAVPDPLTPIRTAAMAAVASRLLARPNSSVLGLFGTTPEIEVHLHALTRLFTFTDVLVGQEVPPLEGATVAEPKDIVAGADIITVVGPGPELPYWYPRGHLHVNAISTLGRRLPRALLDRAMVSPDHAERARAAGECGSLRETQIGPNIARLCASPAVAAQHRRHLTVFDSTGFVSADQVTGGLSGTPGICASAESVAS